jgi:hypothetical protein
LKLMAYCYDLGISVGKDDKRWGHWATGPAEDHAMMTLALPSALTSSKPWAFYYGIWQGWQGRMRLMQETYINGNGEEIGVLLWWWRRCGCKYGVSRGRVRGQWHGARPDGGD